MKKFSQTIKQASSSKLVNTWRIQFDSRRFLITPAHIAVYKKHDQWLISKFLREFKGLNWSIPALYLANFASEDDIAWAEIPLDSEGTVLHLSTDSILYPTNVDFYFRQPYNAEEKWVNNSSFASISSVLYPSPESCLLEAIDVGFRGMSGAIALEQETMQLVGMFVRRGAAVGLKEGAQVPKFVRSKDKDVIGEPLDSMSIEAALPNSTPTISSPNVMPSLSPELKIFCEHIEQKFERLDKKIDTVGNKVEMLENKLEKKMDHLVQNALMKPDLYNLLSIAALRRGLVIPSHIIRKHIETSSAIEIKTFAKLQDDEDD